MAAAGGRVNAIQSFWKKTEMISIFRWEDCQLKMEAIWMGPRQVSPLSILDGIGIASPDVDVISGAHPSLISLPEGNGFGK